MRADRVKIAVYGAGAMGTVLGAFLTEAGVECDLISRNLAHVQAMQKQGAIVDCIADGEKKIIPVHALLPEEMTARYDLIFLMTKQRENKKLAEFLKEKLTSDGVVCTTQNGLPEESLCEILGKERVYGAAVSFGANMLGEGKVELTSKLSSMSMQVGGYQNANDKLPLFEEILGKISAVCKNEEFLKPTKNLAGARWSKLSINAAFSGLSVCTGCTFGKIAKRKKSKKIALAIIRECLAVANALNIAVEPMQGHDLQTLFGGGGVFQNIKAKFVLPIAMKKHALLKSGMLKDVENGRKCEIDFINGKVVELGKRVGVPTPFNKRVVEIVHGIENGLYEISYENLDFFIE